jgi:hypothetical protein
LDTVCALLGAGKGRQQQRGEYGNNRDDNEQFD